MIGVVAAMQAELAAVLAAVGDEGVHEVGGRTFRTGHLGDVPVVAVRSGIGKVAAAVTATLLAERFAPEAVLMVGTAGGLAPDVCVGDVVVADALLQHDVDARPLFPRWEIPGTGRARFVPDAALSAALEGAARDVAGPGAAVHRGLVVSGDVFVADAAASGRLRTDLPDALAVEMEGAALAQVCADLSVPFAVARTVSDRADDTAHVDFGRFVATVAAPHAHDLVVATLARLSNR